MYHNHRPRRHLLHPATHPPPAYKVHYDEPQPPLLLVPSSSEPVYSEREEPAGTTHSTPEDNVASQMLKYGRIHETVQSLLNPKQLYSFFLSYFYITRAADLTNQKIEECAKEKDYLAADALQTLYHQLNRILADKRFAGETGSSQSQSLLRINYLMGARQGRILTGITKLNSAQARCCS